MAARGEMAEWREVEAQQREVEAQQREVEAQQREVAAKLEALTFDPSAAAPGPPGPREGERGDEAVVPPGEAVSCSQPAVAADSESDTDSDSSSTTSSSSSCSSSSTVSDEDDHPNEKDNRRQCVKTKDELPLDELPPVEDLSLILPDNVELKLFGTVSSIIEQLEVEKITFRIRIFECDAPRPLTALSAISTECKGRQYLFS